MIKLPQILFTMYDAFRNGTPTQYTNPRTGLKKDTKRPTERGKTVFWDFFYKYNFDYEKT